MTRDLEAALPATSRQYEWSRRVFQTALHRFDPLLEATRRHASLILTYTDEALDGIPARHRRKARSIVHIGVAEKDVPDCDGPLAPAGSFQVISGGRLVHWKGFDLLLEGFAGFLRASDGDAHLSFTGDGPFRARLERLTRELGIADRVRFFGKVPSRVDVYRRIMDADLYALVTLRDGPPTAVLEAMLAGKPVLCLDIGATREMVPDFAGLKIHYGTRAQMIVDIGEALCWAESHRRELRDMGARARIYARDVHDWRRIGDEVDSIYRSVVDGR